MAMAWIWTVLVAFSVIYGLLNGTIADVSTAAVEGAGAAVTLCIGILGVTCLWSGVMEVMNRAGISQKLAAFLRPVLSRLFPQNAKNEEAMRAVSANVSANLLGLGNAATPFGIQAVQHMARKSGTASDDICRFVVLNTASIQFIPATVAAVRAASGSLAPFEILPAVWVTSLASVTVGILATAFFRRIWRD